MTQRACVQREGTPMLGGTDARILGEPSSIGPGLRRRDVGRRGGSRPITVTLLYVVVAHDCFLAP